MNLKKTHIELGVDEIQQIFAIAMDDDKQQALDFIKKTLAKRVEKSLRRH